LSGHRCAFVLGARTTSGAVTLSTVVSTVVAAVSTRGTAISTITATVTSVTATATPFTAPFTTATSTADWLLTSLLDKAVSILAVLSKSAASAATTTAFTVASPVSAGTSAASTSATALTVLSFTLALLISSSNGDNLSNNLGLLLLSGLFLDGSDCLRHLRDGLDGLALLLGRSSLLLFAIIGLGLRLCWNLLEGFLDACVGVVVILLSEVGHLGGEAFGLGLPFLLAGGGAE